TSKPRSREYTNDIMQDDQAIARALSLEPASHPQSMDVQFHPSTKNSRGAHSSTHLHMWLQSQHRKGMLHVRASSPSHTRHGKESYPLLPGVESAVRVHRSASFLFEMHYAKISQLYRSLH